MPRRRRSLNTVSASLFVDIEKCFEHINHQQIIDAAAKTGFPLKLLRWLLAAYRNKRRITLEGFCGKETTVKNGIIAGCHFSTMLLRMYLLDSIDRVVVSHPAASIRAVVDDISVQVIGAPSYVKGIHSQRSQKTWAKPI